MKGQNFKRVLLRNAETPKKIVFYAKALIVAPASLLIGTIAILFNHRTAALWLKRGFTKLGKIIKPSKRLYG